MKPSHTQQGFTIIETLVAITILMVAIAGPLSIASKGLTGALTSRDQMIATYLAQESIEVVKNIRDNNIAAGSVWVSGLTSCDNSSSTRHCDASAIDTTTIVSSGKSTYPLRITSDTNYYSHENTGRLVPFSRYFYLSEPGSTNACLVSDVECTLTVVVDWSEGSVPYEVLSSTEILDTVR